PRRLCMIAHMPRAIVYGPKLPFWAAAAANAVILPVAIPDDGPASDLDDLAAAAGATPEVDEDTGEIAIPSEVPPAQVGPPGSPPPPAPPASGFLTVEAPGYLPDGYVDKLVKYIPAEVLVFWVTVSQLLDGQARWIVWLLWLVGMAAMLMRWNIANLRIDP